MRKGDEEEKKNGENVEKKKKENVFSGHLRRCQSIEADRLERWPLVPKFRQ